MNWPGLVFGFACAMALAGAAGAAFASRARTAVLSLAAAMLGAAGICLTLGNDFIAIALLVLLGAGVPAAMLAAIALAPPAEPDARPGVVRQVVIPVTALAAFVVLALLLTQTRWAPAGGPRQMQIEWLGSRLLTDHLFTLMLIVAMLAAAAMGAVALLRPRGGTR